MAWLGQRKLENLSISHISEKVFEILENKFGVTQVKYLITLITASRDGLLEAEIIEILQNSKIVDGKAMKVIESLNLKAFSFDRISNETLDQFLVDDGATSSTQ